MGALLDCPIWYAGGASWLVACLDILHVLHSPSIMKNTIKLNNEVSIDLPKLIETRLLVQANSGGGKSYAIRRIVEQAFGKVQIIILDPEGEFTNLRTEYDFIYAGKGGDAAVEARSAGLLATRLLELKASTIVDLYELAPQDRKHFVRLFCEAMVNAPKELWHDTLIIIDEAHVFAPERGESEAMGPVIDLATRGRKRGYCVVLATQRLPKLNKDATAECNNKLIGRASQDIDRKRAAEELGFTSRDQILSLRDLDPGEFYVFGPAISREVQKIKIGEVKVIPPKRGSARSFTPPPPSAAVKKILAELKDLPQEAAKEAKTIQELTQALTAAKRQITVLERGSKAQAPDPEAIKRLTDKAYGLGSSAAEQSFKGELKDLRGRLSKISAIIGIEIPVSTIKPPKLELPPPPRPLRELYSSEVVHVKNPEHTFSPGLSKGARSIFTYLNSVYPGTKSKTQIWVAAGYSPGGGFNNLMYELSGRFLIEKMSDGRYRSVEDVDSSLLDSSFDPSLSKWDSKLSLGARKIFHLLLNDSDIMFSKDVIAQETGYALGGGFNNLIYELTGKELVVKVGTSYQINPEILDL